MKKIPQFLAFCVAALISFSTLFVLTYTVKAAEMPGFVDDIYLTTTIDSVTHLQDGDIVSIYDPIYISIEWSVDATVEAGDTATFKLPDELNLNPSLNSTIRWDLNNDIIIANVTAPAGAGSIVTVTFTEEAKNKPDLSGQMKIKTEFISTITEGNHNLVCVDSAGNNADVTLYVNIPAIDPNELVNKWGYVDPINSNIIHWAVRVNFKKDTIPIAVLTDTIGEGHEMVLGTMNLTRVDYFDPNDGHQINPTYPINSVTDTITISQNLKGFTMDFGADGINGEGYLVEFDSIVIDNNALRKYTNTAVFKGITDAYTVFTVIGGGIGGGEEGSIAIHTTDSESGEAVVGAEFDLIRESDNYTYKLVTDTNGNAKVIELLAGEYSLIETKASVGYVLESQQIPVTIDEVNMDVTIEITESKTLVAPLPSPKTGNNLSVVACFAIALSSGALLLVTKRKK